MSNVTPLKIPTPGTFLGEFHIERFDIANKEERKKYERIRTQANKPDSGIVIENVRDQVETSEVTDDEGNRFRNERWYVVVSWWDKGTKEDKSPDPERGFYVEKKVGDQND